jgi:hypothetical protein
MHHRSTVLGTQTHCPSAAVITDICSRQPSQPSNGLNKTAGIGLTGEQQLPSDLSAYLATAGVAPRGKHSPAGRPAYLAQRTSSPLSTRQPGNRIAGSLAPAQA